MDRAADAVRLERRCHRVGIDPGKVSPRGDGIPPEHRKRIGDLGALERVAGEGALLGAEHRHRSGVAACMVLGVDPHRVNELASVHHPGGAQTPACQNHECSRERVGVVLLTDEEMPEQLGHLARGRHDRDGMPASGAHSLVERTERAGRSDGGEG